MMARDDPAIMGWRLDHAILTHADSTPDKPALQFDDTVISYARLDRMVAGTAAWLAGQMKIGDRFACYSMNHPAYFVLLLAAARMGAIMVPLNWRLSPAELGYQIRDCAPKMLIYGTEFADMIDQLIAPDADIITVSIEALAQEAGHDNAPELAAKNNFDNRNFNNDDFDRDLLIVYTSGTTGRPKGAVLSQRAMRSNAIMSHHAYDMRADDVVLNVLPLFHVGGLNIQPVPALIIGATVILEKTFDPAATLHLIEQSGVTLMNSVPTILGALCAHPHWPETNLGSMRMFSIGSTDVPVALINQVHQRGVRVVQIYGATETAPSAIYQTADIAFDTIGSIGRAGCDNTIRLVDDGGNDVENGSVGEIWVKGDNVFTGYWQDDAATATAKTDGWFHTGDMARRDDAGLYWFADRVKHVIISGGENIYPAELERVLAGHPGLVEFSIIGRDDDRWGQVPVVVAVRRDAALSKEDILQVFTPEIARFKQPKDVIFLDYLPRNALGKILVDEVAALIST